MRSRERDVKNVAFCPSAQQNIDRQQVQRALLNVWQRLQEPFGQTQGPGHLSRLRGNGKGVACRVVFQELLRPGGMVHLMQF